jgi:hypothetical protein
MRQLPRLLAFLFFCALLVAAVMTFNRPQRPAQPMQPSESLQTVPARPTYPEIGAEVVEEQSQPGIAADLPADSSAAAQLPVPADQEVLAIPPQLLYSQPGTRKLSTWSVWPWASVSSACAPPSRWK